MNNAEQNQFQNFLALIHRVVKIAHHLKLAILILSIPTLIAFGIGLFYFSSISELGNWSWGIPCCVMLPPILCIIIVWWVLDAITSLPEVCSTNKNHLISVVKHHRTTLAEAENNKLSKFKYLSIIGKVLYNSTEVIDGVKMAAFASTPIFWVIYTITFIGSITLSAMMLFGCLLHYLLT